MRHVAVAVALALALALPGTSSAEVGDYRFVQGRIALWPPEPFAYGVAVLQTDTAQPYFVEFTPVTAGSVGLRPGDVVAMVGREGPTPDRLTALTVERRATGYVPGNPGWQTIRGIVESVSGSTAVLRIRDGGRITADLSEMTGSQLKVQPGQDLTVTGLVLSPTVIRVRGMATPTDSPPSPPRVVRPR